MKEQIETLLKHGSRVEILIEQGKIAIVEVKRKLKMKEAKKLIREGNHNITQISEILGYSSIHHFTRMFKRVTGFSPTMYKTSVRL